MSADDVSNADAVEIRTLLGLATRPRVRALLESRLRELSVTAVPVVLPVPVAHIPASVSATITYTTPRYGWEQDNEYVSVLCFELTGVGAVKADVSCTFTAHSFSLLIPSLDGRAYALRVPQLEKDIDPALSSYKVKKNSIEVKLFKAGKWVSWGRNWWERSFGAIPNLNFDG